MENNKPSQFGRIDYELFLSEQLTALSHFKQMGNEVAFSNTVDLLVDGSAPFWDKEFEKELDKIESWFFPRYSEEINILSMAPTNQQSRYKQHAQAIKKTYTDLKYRALMKLFQRAGLLMHRGERHGRY